MEWEKKSSVFFLSIARPKEKHTQKKKKGRKKKTGKAKISSLDSVFPISEKTSLSKRESSQFHYFNKQSSLKISTAPVQQYEEFIVKI